MAGLYWNGIILEPSSYSFLSPKGKTETVHVLVDNHGFPLSKESFEKIKKEIIEYLKRVEQSYDNPNIDAYLNWIRTEARLSYAGFQQNENGKFVIPKPNVNAIKCKKFNPNKHKWSFKCSWCGKKVSIDTQEYYYTILFDRINYFEGYKTMLWERSCSKECAVYLWYDIHKEWIHEKGLKDCFEL